MSKKTGHLLAGLQRKRGIRDLAQRFLIVCEDDKSAPNYFESLKRFFGLSATSIVVAGSEGHTQPTQVVARAIRQMIAARDSGDADDAFAQVWCVIDGDYGPKVQAARDLAVTAGIRLAVSTTCFEYWVLLHFEDSAAPAADGWEMVQQLKTKHLPSYAKGSCNFDLIVKHVKTACKRAEIVRKAGVVRGESAEQQNPCSEIYLLIREILGASSTE